MNGTPGLLRNRHSFANEAFAAAKSGQAAFSDRVRSRFRTTGLRVLAIYPPISATPLPWMKPSGNAVAMSATNER